MSVNCNVLCVQLTDINDNVRLKQLILHHCLHVDGNRI